jgi:hypothetical protein
MEDGEVVILYWEREEGGEAGIGSSAKDFIGISAAFHWEGKTSNCRVSLFPEFSQWILVMANYYCG